MFFQRTELPACAEGDLVSLRTSMNSPVVSTDDQPPAPARAAIAVQRGALPRLFVSVAVRPIGVAGPALVFRPDVSSEQTETVATLVEAALSFGESMGFLFDDDEVEGADRERRREAAARWNDFLTGTGQGEVKPDVEDAVTQSAASATRAAPSGRAGGSDFDPEATIELEAAIEPGPGVEPEPAIELEEPLESAPARAPEASKPATRSKPASPPLTKFRRSARASEPPAATAPPLDPPPAVEPPAPAPLDAGSRPPAPVEAPIAAPPIESARIARGRAPLARLQLVKRARDGDDRSRAGWLARLLGSF